MSTIFKLIIEDDEGKTTVYPLVDGEVSIGRKEGNTIRLMERNVSRRHARLLRDEEAVFLEDLDSYNGVRINGERIASRFRVREGDLIEIGDYHLALQRASAGDDISDQATQPLGDENDTHDSHEGDPGWPAGTVPDFRLPNDLLSGAQLPRELAAPAEAESRAPRQGPRDTVMDEPAPGPFDPAAGLESAVGLESGDPSERPSQRPTDRPTEKASGDRGFARAPREESALPPFPATGAAQPDEVLTPRPSRRAEALVREPAEEGETRQLNRGPAHVAETPRLVCVSTQYAGREFPLDRDELIIGRVEENDIVIEHRSVSRNHAKIRLDGRTHRIIDLQSANGILVNGEEYAMTNLRSGDLIELGNVRFRFVPAGEPFEATDEEAREMRAHGVEPPGAEDAAVARARPYDPSTAATVTDAPRSALTTPSPFVQSVTVGRLNGAASGPESRAVHRETVPNDRADTRTDPAPRAASTAATAVIGTAGLPLSEAPQPSPEGDRGRGRGADLDEGFEGYEATSRGPSYRPMMFGLIAILAALVSVLAFLFLTRGDAALDRRLEELYNQGNYAEVTKYYETHDGSFADATKAAILLGRAEARLEAPERNGGGAGQAAPPEAPDEGATRARAETELDVTVTTEPVEAAPDPDPEPEPPRAAAERTRRRRAESSARRDEARSKQAARRLSRLGRDALIAGDMTKAQRYLNDCIEREPGYAPCHRSLGVLYGHKKQSDRAVHHYRRYIELAPDAADAERFRSIIRDFESEEIP